MHRPIFALVAILATASAPAGDDPACRRPTPAPGVEKPFVDGYLERVDFDGVLRYKGFRVGWLKSTGHLAIPIRVRDEEGGIQAAGAVEVADERLLQFIAGQLGAIGYGRDWTLEAKRDGKWLRVKDAPP
jgi:hypothetical protein